MTKRVLGKDLKVGDHLVVLLTPFPIERFEEYPNGGPTIDGVHHKARIAIWTREDDEHRVERGMTVFDEEPHEVEVDEPVFADHLDFANFLDGLFNPGPVS